jgi:hypothetical protein
VDGGTQLNRLDAAALEEWLQDYSLGQLWEKNHFGGRPTSSGARARSDVRLLDSPERRLPSV